MKPTKTSISRLSVICLFVAMSSVVFAQNGELVKQEASIYGRLVGKEKRQGIAHASVQLFQKLVDKTSLLTSVLSSKKGEFYFEDLDPAFDYLLQVHATGYLSREIQVTFSKNQGSFHLLKELRNIELEVAYSSIDTVNVTSTLQMLQLYPDKRVYMVEKDISTAGSTAEDALKNIPGIVVDIDGAVLVRNSPPQIFIDGRPSTLLLAQIPADHVDRIELMTNPSVKYDAFGTGGIVNLILKKNRAPGYSGNLRAGLDSRLQPLGGGDFNFRTQKINFFGSAQMSGRKSLGTASSQRTEYFDPGSLLTRQENAPESRGYYGFARAGVDFFANYRTTFTGSGSFAKGNYRVSDILFIHRDSLTNSTARSSIERKLGADIDFESVSALFAFKHNFPQAGREITADFSFSQHLNDNTSKYISRYFDSDGNPKPSVGAELATGQGTSRFYTFQTDFINPGSKQSKFESGLRVAAREYESFNRNYREDTPGSSDFRLLPETGVEFNFDDIVMAAYGNYSNSIKAFSYQFGLRLESSFYEGVLVNKALRFKTDYPVNLFPAVYLSRKLDQHQSLQVNYSRKISRPNFFQILPFVDFSDSLNISVGNPALLPEFSNIGELIYQLDYKNNQAFFATAYLKQSSDLITRYQFKAPNTDPAFTDSIIYNSFANAGSSYTYGLELLSRNRISNWWEILANVNLFEVQLNAANLPGATDQQQKSWFAKMTQNWKLPHHVNLQLSADYQAKTLLPPGFSRNSSNSGFGGGVYGFTANISQGYIKPIYGVDLSIKKDFLKNNAASVSLQVNDIFRTRTYETVASSAFFQQENFRRRDPQVLRLNFSWRFGKVDTLIGRRKNQRNEVEALQLQQGGQ